MIRRLSLAAALATCVIVAPLAQTGAPAAQKPAEPVTPEKLTAAIDQLGNFDFPIRTEAARTVRRAPADLAIAELSKAVRGHKDEYVRFKALVLLAGLGDTAARELIRFALSDRNDRLRTVAAGWYEHHPDPAVIPTLVEALKVERSEFVRPAITRALAAQGDDPRARAALVPLVMQGADFFRGSVIQALGDFNGRYALDSISAVAKLEGPLQDDAITALGMIGDPTSLETVIGLQKTAPRFVQPTVSAAICLLGRNCDAHMKYLVQALDYGLTVEDQVEVLRGAVHGLGMLASRGREEALTVMLERGATASEDAREPIALAVGLIAMRNPAMLLKVLVSRPNLDPAIALLRDAFDQLNEDYEEERFYVFVRRAYWAAAEGSSERRVAETLIRQLEF
ncbi:MAG TPA: HEAT repeat domain-containing protein [Vicinamibacterales bacterium]|nr:HEAT repeat domain-containing protein [Vicinamibacterales bacterium]